MSQPRIPLLVPDLPKRAELSQYLDQMDQARWYTNFGPLSRRFERGLQTLFANPAPEISTMANCTLALELALTGLRLSAGANVLIPAFTFAATASAVLRAGLRPVFADIDPFTWVLTPSIARAAMRTMRIACVMPVAALGCPVPVDQWDVFSEQSGIPVLVDAAAALGNQSAGERVVLAFSMHATKALGIGEGGLVVARDTEFIARVRRLANFGIDPTTGRTQDVGSNAKMSEFHAAVGLAALERWPDRRQRRLALHASYCQELARHCPGLTLQSRPADGSYTILQVVLPMGIPRERVIESLAREDIETRTWYLPLVPDHQAYRGFATLDLPIARSLGPRMLGLPFHLELSEENVRRVCAALARAIS